MQATANTIIINQVSYFCWLTAIIQKPWETLWDILAHQNVELLEQAWVLPFHVAFAPACPKDRMLLVCTNAKYMVNRNEYFIISTFIFLVEVLYFFLEIWYMLVGFFWASHRKRIQQSAHPFQYL